MSTIDNNIVEMTFDNQLFEQRLSDTIASLDKLSAALENVGSINGLSDVSAAMDNFDAGPMSDAIESISEHFTALGAVAFSVIQHITDATLNFAQNISEDVLGPIITGGKRRATNIQNAQFQFRGLGLDVQEVMGNALDAVKGTAFGLDEAAKAAAQFGASGVSAGKDMTAALTAISGAAAMTNTSFGEIAQIFTSSAGTGVVNNQDLLQFGTRGLNAAAAVAKVMGKTEQQIHEMASAGKLDFQTFANAMNEAFGEHAKDANQTYTGSLANLHAAMSRLGAAFIGPRLEQERDLFNAISPAIDKVASALKPVIDAFTYIGRLGVDRLIGGINKLDFTNLIKSMPNFGTAFINLFRVAIQIIDTFKEAFRDIFPAPAESRLVKISEAIKTFTDKLIMGGSTLEKVKDIFHGFFSAIAIGIKIVEDTAKLIAGVVTSLLAASGVNIGGGLLSFFSNLGESVTNLKKNLVDNGGIDRFFSAIVEGAKKPIDAIIRLKNAVHDFLFGVDSGGNGDKFEQGFGRAEGSINRVEDTVNRVQSRFQNFKDDISGIGDAWDALTTRFKAVFDVLGQIGDYISNWFSELGSKIAASFGPGDFNAAVDVVNVGLIGAITLMFKKFLEGDGLAGTLGGKKFTDLLETIKGQFTDTFAALQAKLKGEALQKIAVAIAVLAASIAVLSLIDSAALTKAMIAIAVGFKELLVVMGLMNKIIDNSRDAAKLGVLAAAMIAISSAMVVLSLAITILSRLDMGELAKGLLGVSVGLGAMVIAINFMTADVSGLVRASITMNLVATGLVVLSEAVKLFSNLGWAEMAKGMVGVGVGLGILAIGMRGLPPSSIISGAGLIETATGLLVLGEAVKLFSTLGWAEMTKGMVGIGFGLALIGDAMRVMPLSLPITAAGVLILSGALLVMAEAVKLMGSMDLGTLAKGVGAFAVMLVILVGAMNGAESALPGAAAMVVMAGALLILTEVLEKIAALSVGDIVKGLLTIAATLGVLAVAAILMAEGPTEALLLLGIALGVVGGAFALFGAGASLLAKAFEIMATSGVAGAKAIVESIQIIIGAVPDLAAALALAVVKFAEDFLNAAPLLIKLVTVLLGQILDTIIELAPKLAKALGIFITEGLKLIRDHFPELVETGVTLLLSLLRGIRDNIGEITRTVAEIVVGFLDALREKVPEIVNSVVDLVTTIITEVAYKVSSAAPTLFVDVGIAIINGLLDGLAEAASRVYDFFGGLPGKILEIIKSALGINSPSTVFMEIGGNIIEGLLNGLINAVGTLFTWFTELPANILGWVADLGSTLKNKGIDIITGFLSGVIDKAKDLASWYISLPLQIIGWIGDVTSKLTDKGIEILGGFFGGILKKVTEIVSWFQSLPDQIVGWIGDLSGKLAEVGRNAMAGFIKGIVDSIPFMSTIVEGAAGSAASAFKGPLYVKSPSRLFHEIGVNVLQGFINGIKSMVNPTTELMSSLSNRIIDNFDAESAAKNISDTLNKVVLTLGDMSDFNPTITPVLDLSKVEAGAAGINRLMGQSSIAANVSLSRARSLATTAEERQAVDVTVPDGQRDVTFIQNINSPKPLSTNDIYRGTKSQIANAKEVLKIA